MARKGRSKITHVLFVCSQNKLRSPTAEQVFSSRADLEVASAGTNHDAETPLSDELVAWADVIFVMERTHQQKLQQKYRSALSKARVICLNIPDDFAFMDPALIARLMQVVPRHLPSEPPKVEG